MCVVFILRIHGLYAGICTFININCNIAQQMGIIPLHCAAVRGMSDAVKALLKAISNMNEKDKASIIQ